MNHLNGACPRFGSCHLRAPSRGDRASNAHLRRQQRQADGLGLIGAFAPVLAPLLEAIASGVGALGREVDACAFVEGLLRGNHTRERGVFAPAMTHSLNDYIEAGAGSRRAEAR